MKQDWEPLWDVGEISFYYKPLQSPVNPPGLPDTMPFRLAVDRNSGLVVREVDEKDFEYLELAYSDGSEITGMMGDDGIGRAYADDFLSYIGKHVPASEMAGMSVLEIGCGTGYLLSRLQSQGATVFGVEPGEHGQLGAQRYGVPVAREYFPGDSVQGKRFDLIILYDVLEHMPDPQACIEAIDSYLTENGRVLVSVENEEGYMRHGDFSFLFHEHMSYFTKDSLSNVIQAQGFEFSHVQDSEFGRSIHCCARRATASTTRTPKVAESVELASAFVGKAQQLISRLGNLIESSAEAGQSLGVYVPGRFINILTVLDVPTSHIRFFDDNADLTGTYFPGVNVVVETGEQLIASPVDTLLIMSDAFGEKIRQRVAPQLPEQTRVLTWKDVFVDGQI